MKTRAIFYLFCALFIAGWVFVYSRHHDYLLPFCFVGFSVAWALYRLPTVQARETLTTFFLYERKMPRNEFVGTLVTTNVGFFSSVAFSTVLIVTTGIGPALIAVVAWAVGLVWFAKYIPTLLPFFRRGTTVHEYIAEAYGRTPGQKRHLRFYSSVITFLLYVASVGAEIKFTSDVFSAPTGLSTGWLALALCVAGVIYVSISGYRGVVSTDRLRFWAILAGVLAIYFFLWHGVSTAALAFPAGYFSLRMLTVGPSVASLLSLVVLLALYQFCVMDMWERCISIVNSDFAQNVKNPDDVIIRTMRRMISGSIIPFVVLFGAWYGLGLLALGQQWSADPNEIIPQFISRLQVYASSGVLGSVVETLVVLCFSAAALSTIDGFIIAAVQTVIFDWLPSFRKTHVESDQLPDNEAKRILLWSRVLVLLVGGVAVTIAYLSFQIMSFWVGMYSLMLSFFPAIFISLWKGEPNRRRSAGQVAVSIVSGAVAALIVAIVGTFFLTAYPLLTVLPPFMAVGVASLVMVAKTDQESKDGETQTKRREGVKALIIILVATVGLFTIFLWRSSTSDGHEHKSVQAEPEKR